MKDVHATLNIFGGAGNNSLQISNKDYTGNYGMPKAVLGTFIAGNYQNDTYGFFGLGDTGRNGFINWNGNFDSISIGLSNSSDIQLTIITVYTK